MKEKLKKYIKDNYIQEKKKKTLFKNIIVNEEKYIMDECSVGASNIDNYISNNLDNNNFKNLLFKYIDNKNMKDSDVYNKVNIDRRLFSKIRGDIHYHPSKETIILLGLSLELNENELLELLESASYSLPKNNYFDLIIRFCFINKIYKLTDVNDLLNNYDCKLFNY